MVAPVAPNPDLALWIAGLGFFSSLAVVLINALVTKYSKKIDAQIKKDEQSYGYNMEYLKRKLNAGEKEIAKLNSFLNTLSWDYFYYGHTLKKQYINKERIQSLHERNNEIIINSQQDSSTPDDSFYAYFEQEVDFHNPNHILRKYEEALHELISLNAELYRDDAPLRKALEEKADDTIIATPLIAFKDLYDKTQDKTKAFLELNKDAQTYTLNMISRISKEMKSMSNY